MPAYSQNSTARVFALSLPLILILVTWILISFNKDLNEIPQTTVKKSIDSSTKKQITTPEINREEKSTLAPEVERLDSSSIEPVRLPHTLYGTVRYLDDGLSREIGSVTVFLKSGESRMTLLSDKHKSYKFELFREDDVRALFKIPGHPPELHDIPLDQNEKSTQYNLTIESPQKIAVRIQDEHGLPFIDYSRDQEDPIKPLMMRFRPHFRATLRHKLNDKSTLPLSSKGNYRNQIANEIYQMAFRLPPDSKKDTVGHLLVRNYENQNVNLVAGYNIIDSRPVVNNEVLFTLTTEKLASLIYQVKGKVVDSFGNPVKEAPVSLDLESQRINKTKTNLDGEFHIELAGSGVFNLVVNSEENFTINELIHLNVPEGNLVDLGVFKLTPAPKTNFNIQLDTKPSPNIKFKLFLNPLISATDFQSSNTLIKTWLSEKISLTNVASGQPVSITKLPSNPFNLVVSSNLGLLYATTLDLPTEPNQLLTIKLPEKLFNVILKFNFSPELENSPATLFDSKLRPLKNFVIKSGEVHNLMLAKGAYKLIMYSVASDVKIINEVELDVTKSELVETP